MHPANFTALENQVNEKQNNKGSQHIKAMLHMKPKFTVYQCIIVFQCPNQRIPSDEKAKERLHQKEEFNSIHVEDELEKFKEDMIIALEDARMKQRKVRSEEDCKSLLRSVHEFPSPAMETMPA
ncbi:Sodium/potassium/calcium exchanger 4 [Manis javanica]|nr:Sodium/potassium/calcium exchanger 4 [Manis javanica]